MRGGFRHSELGCFLAVGGLVGAVVLTSVLGQLTLVEARETRIVSDQRVIHSAIRRHLLREGTLPGSLAELQDEELGPDPRDPWGQPYLYLPHRDARGNATEYALVSLGPDGGQGDLRVDWSEAPAVQQPERVESAPSGVGLSHLLPPLLSAGLAGALGLGVWWFGRMPVWRRTGGFEPPAWVPEAQPGPRVSLHRAPSAIHCAWCHDSASELPLITCRGCGTVLHGECWGLAVRCPTLGCRRKAPAARDPGGAGTVVPVDRSEPVDAVGGLS